MFLITSYQPVLAVTCTPTPWDEIGPFYHPNAPERTSIGKGYIVSGMAESVDHAQIVMAVAIIAIARKVIILDVKELSGLALVGIAAIILALSIGYYLIKKKDAALKESPHNAL